MNELTNEEKLKLFAEKISKLSENTLIAPHEMRSPLEGRAYMLGATAAFKQIAEMAKYTLEKVADV